MLLHYTLMSYTILYYIYVYWTLLCYTIIHFNIINWICPILCYAVVSYIFVYYTDLYCTILCCAILYSTILCDAILSYPMLCDAMLCYTVLHNTIIWYCIVKHCIVYDISTWWKKKKRIDTCKHASAIAGWAQAFCLNLSAARQLTWMIYGNSMTILMMLWRPAAPRNVPWILQCRQRRIRQSRRDVHQNRHWITAAGSTRSDNLDYIAYLPMTQTGCTPWSARTRIVPGAFGHGTS